MHFLPPRSKTQADATPTDDLIAERSRLEKAVEMTRLLAAPIISDAEAAIRERNRRTTEQSAALKAHKVRRTFGLRPEEPLEEHHVTEWGGGLLEQQLRRLERAGADQETLRALHERQHEPSERYRADPRYYGIEAFVYGVALRAYTVDPSTRELTSTEPVNKNSSSVQWAIEQLIARWEDINNAGFKLPPPEKMRDNPLDVLGKLLRRLGLRTRTGRNEAARSHYIDQTRLEHMNSLIARREEREIEKRAPGSHETPNPFNKETNIRCLKGVSAPPILEPATETAPAPNAPASDVTAPTPEPETEPGSPQPPDEADEEVARLAAMNERLEGIHTLVAALPAEKRVAALNTLLRYRCNREPVDTATAGDLRAEARAFRFCARRWQHGLPGNPAEFLPPPIPSAAPPTHERA